MDKIFRPQDVDSVIPKLESIFTHMESCRKRAQELASVRPPEGADPSAAEVAEAARVRSQIEFLLEGVQEDVEIIARMGGVVKDLFMGLVDFLGKVDGEEVWLCWKRGEKKIQFWHPHYAGFSERQALGRAENKPSITH